VTADTQSLERVTRELAALEPIFHRPESGKSRADFEAMMADDFFEVGASGKKYPREFVLEALELRLRSPVTEDLSVTDFACRRICKDVYLVTYQLEQAHNRLSRRSTLWQMSAGGWKALYHQGTLISSVEGE
jgi:hypothetical protein